MWLEQLTEEDRAFLKRFLLCSGSLKGVAREYGVSYPTVRLRLDRLIAKVKVVDDERIRGEFERYVRILEAEGKVDRATAEDLLARHRAEKEKEG